MRPLSLSTILTTSFLLSSTQIAVAAPNAIGPVQPDERDIDLSSILGAATNLTGDLSNLITDATSLLQDFIVVLQELHNSTNANDLINLLGMNVTNADDDTANVTNSTVGAVSPNATCPGMAVLFAKGTAEPGNLGLYTGPSFVTALRNYVNGSTTVAVQGIPYAASVKGFKVGGSPYGSAVMAKLVSRTNAACPNTKIVLAGYSQGSQLVHNAMSLINTGTLASQAAATTTTQNSTTGQPRSNAAAINSRVMSVVLFGDPLNGTAVSGIQPERVLSLCNAQDVICAQHGDIITLDHLTYNQDAPQAAMFVMQKSGLGVASADAVNQGMGNVPAVKQVQGMDRGAQIGSGAGLPISGFLTTLGKGQGGD